MTPRGTAARAAGVRRALSTARRRLGKARRIHGANLRSLLRAETAPDGLPIPPAKLRFLSVGSTDVASFLDGGERLARMIEGALARHGADPNGFDSVLEFGVGCGRIIRHWRGLEGEVHGTDYNAAAVDWCAGNLRFATFRRNELAPPLPYPDGKFGFAYAYSVFTHLPENLQEIWLADLRRVVREGGLVLFTTHGNRFADARLTGEELERFRRGELVVRGSDVPGSNRCAAFHPQAYVREHLARGFDVLELRASTADGPSQQDVYLLQRQSSHSSWSK